MNTRYTSEITVTVKQQVGSDATICDTARVSTLGEEADEYVRNEERDDKLINYLMRSRHGSPFEHGLITFIVHAPHVVFWDHVRHRIGVSYNIESSRYRELQPVFYRPAVGRTQTGKPGAYVIVPGTDRHTAVVHETRETVGEIAWEAYQRQLRAGVAREQAMEILPQNIMLTAYITFNPRSLMNFIELRDEHARLEMQMVAHRFRHFLGLYWPTTLECFEKHGDVAP